MNPELLTSVACFYTLVHKFPTDVGAFQVLCTNLFFGPLTFFTDKFTILGLNILNLHNLGHVYFLPKSDMPEVKGARTHHLSRVFGAGKLTSHKCCEV